MVKSYVHTYFIPATVECSSSSFAPWRDTKVQVVTGTEYRGATFQRVASESGSSRVMDAVMAGVGTLEVQHDTSLYDYTQIQRGCYMGEGKYTLEPLQPLISISAPWR